MPETIIHVRHHLRLAIKARPAYLWALRVLSLVAGTLPAARSFNPSELRFKLKYCLSPYFNGLMSLYSVAIQVRSSPPVKVVCFLLYQVKRTFSLLNR